MSANAGISRIVGIVIGLAMVGAAVYSVFFIDWKAEPSADPMPVRPLKTLVVGAPQPPLVRNYPGKVRANTQVDLAFQVAGPLISLPVKNGLEVNAGDVLATVDPRDFENQLAAEVAAFTKASSDLEKIEELAKVNAASAREMIDAKAAFDVSKANVAIAQKAIADTFLKAPFAGRIANTYVENFQNVQAKEPILSLQEIQYVEVEVNLPEQRIALAKESDRDKIRWVATFDYLPGRSFDVTLKEFAVEADPLTQTYRVAFVMEAPEDVNILPGMTAMLTEYHPEVDVSLESSGFVVPIEAVPADGLGQYFVWLLKESDGMTSTVHRTEVTVGDMVGDAILITQGIHQGDRIAAAGVHVLQEGQTVRLMTTDSKEGAL